MLRILWSGGILLALLLAGAALADTGGSASAVLHIVGGGPSPAPGPAGGTSGEGASCVPPALPLPPVLWATQGLASAGGEAAGDLFRYSAEVTALSPDPLDGLRFLVLLSPGLEPASAPEGARYLRIGPFAALDIPLPALAPGETVRVDFSVRAAADAGDVLYAQGYAYSRDLALAAGDTRIPGAVFAPAWVALRPVAGAAASVGALTKDAHVEPAPIGPRVASSGDTVVFSLTLVPEDGAGMVHVVDVVPAPLAVDRGSLPPGAEAVDLGGLTLVHFKLEARKPGEAVGFGYRARVSGDIVIPFAATRAIAAFPDGTVVLSDDPASPAQGDPTAILFPWLGKADLLEEWEAIKKRGDYVIPVAIRRPGGRSEIRWARWGKVRAEVDRSWLELVGFAAVPTDDLPHDGGAGLLFAASPPADLYIPVVYGYPVFAPLGGGAIPVADIPPGLCGGTVYLPLLAEVAAGHPGELKGLVADEGL